jgi:hypothetical protein
VVSLPVETPRPNLLFQQRIGTHLTADGSDYLNLTVEPRRDLVNLSPFLGTGAVHILRNAVGGGGGGFTERYYLLLGGGRGQDCVT